jgi:hypothetical protein
MKNRVEIEIYHLNTKEDHFLEKIMIEFGIEYKIYQDKKFSLSSKRIVIVDEESFNFLVLMKEDFYFIKFNNQVRYMATKKINVPDLKYIVGEVL